MKKLLPGAIIGLLFLIGGFGIGLRLAKFPSPPAPKSKVPELAAVVAITAPTDPITPEALRKTSEGMMELNQSLKTREQQVALREQKAKEQEEELHAEQDALVRSHEKFNQLFLQFQNRLQLVEANQLEQAQRQNEIYQAMDPMQAIDILRGRDDASLTRLFSVMEVKPLAKLIAGWKTKYPDDTARLLGALDAMGQVMPKDKISLPEAVPPADSGTPVAASDAAPPANPGAPAPTADVPSAASTVDPASAPVSDPASNSAAPTAGQ